MSVLPEKLAHTLMCLSPWVAQVGSSWRYCPLLQILFMEFPQISCLCSASFCLPGGGSQSRNKQMTDILLWCVVGFRVDLDKVIFFHDTLPRQSLVVFIFETLNNETKKNIQLFCLPLSLLNQHPLGILRYSGTKRMRFVLHRLIWLMLLTSDSGRAMHEFLGNNEELEMSAWTRNAIFILNRDPSIACPWVLRLSKIISLMIWFPHFLTVPLPFWWHQNPRPNIQLDNSWWVVYFQPKTGVETWERRKIIPGHHSYPLGICSLGMDLKGNS